MLREMNYCVPDWNMEDDLIPVANQKKSMGPDHELVELLWRNGQVVLHSQTHRKQGPIPNGSRLVQKPDQPILKGGSLGNGISINLVQEDETESWIQYPLEDSLEKDFCSEFFYELPNCDSVEIDKQNKQFKGDKDVKLGSSEEANVLTKSRLVRSHQSLCKQTDDPNFVENQNPNPGLRIPNSIPQGSNLGGLSGIVNFSHCSSNGPIRTKKFSTAINGEVGEASIMTIGSSHCGSNQVPNELDLSRFSSDGIGDMSILEGPQKEDSKNVVSQSERRQTDILDTTVTSSSGGSGASIGRTDKQSTSHKRKGRDADDSECQSEEPEFESAQTKKCVQRSGTTRRNRAAEVHNLSERRRRDRINEKMKALQELIPHCNKTDKASMLDEAIEYLKSLQLQVQLMWMGGGMAPMMFPGVQHYMARMGMGMGPPPLPSIHNPMQLQRVPILDQSITAAPTPNHQAMCHTPVLNPVNFQNQMQNPNFPEQYAHYMGFHPMQTTQHMNMFGYACQPVQENDKMTSPSTTAEPLNTGAPNVNIPNGKLG